MDATLVKTAKISGSADDTATALVPHLFLVLESRRLMALSARYSLERVDEVIVGRGKTRTVEYAGNKLVIRVPDPWMSSTHGRITRTDGTYTFTDTKSTNGSIINGAPVSQATVSDGDILELGQTFFLFRTALPVLADEPDHLDACDVLVPDGLVSLVPSLSRRFAQLGQVVKSDTPVMLLGQTGTGKEIMARAAHALAGRPGAFVPVNCGALPDTLIESQFFGHRKGAFSGATEDSPGLVRAAHRGTLFLDEIGDMPLSSQAALLRVLQEREVTPVGATTPVAVDFRLISATHRDLERLVEQGRFREDLLARLSGFVLELPPLCQRIEDLGVITGALLRDLAGDGPVQAGLSNEAARALLRYSWPRNIRELRACLQTALALASDRKIALSHLSPPVRKAVEESPAAAEPEPRPLSDEQEQRRQELIALLREHGGNISAVARAMGKVRSQVQRWIKRYGLNPDAYRE